MRIPFLPIFMTSPFDGLLEHAEKVKECVWAFQQAIECYASEQCKTFQEYHQEVDKLESEADAIKASIRGHMPLGVRMPVSKFQLFMYINEQDKVCDSIEQSLEWVSYRMIPGFPEKLKKDLFLLVDAVIEPIEDLSRMVAEAKKYFDTYSDKQRDIVKGIINNIQKKEHEADGIEGEIKHKIFSLEKDPVGVLHGVKLAELISSIADHAENAGDMMRAIIARKKGIFFNGKT
jgi:predicted phosphate transport protein (TIGR00153 family)